MLCSLPNAKSSSTSTPTWLDRLHTRQAKGKGNDKGFDNPTPIAVPLPLPPPPLPSTSTSPSPAPSPSASPSPSPSPSPSQSPSPSSGHVMTSILADLFVMDHPPRSSLHLQSRGTLRLRKQPSPKICIFTSVTAPAATPHAPHLKNKQKKHTANLNLKQRTKHHHKKKTIQPHGRTEATVIDTSTPGWKSPKILIRKGPTFWKILDKKQWNAAPSKRKRLNLASAKQKPLLDSDKPSHPPYQGDNNEESIDVMQVPVKRPKCSKLPPIPEAAKSIAVNLKVRTKGKKKGPSSSSSTKEKVRP